MGLSADEVAKVALLARLRLSPDELETFTGQLNSIVEFVAQLQELDTTDVEPLAHGVEVRNVFRDDVRGPVPAPRGRPGQRPEAQPRELPRPRRARMTRPREPCSRSRSLAIGPRRPELETRSMDPTRATATGLLAQMNAGAVTVRGGRPGLPRSRRAPRAGSTSSSTSTPSTSWRRPAPVDAQRKAGEPLGPLAGVPVAIKDVLCVEGEPTTCGSRMLENFRPPYDATVIAQPEGGRRGPDRQDEHGRVRDGLVHREQRLRADPQPLGRRRASPAARRAARPRPSPPTWRPLALGSDTGGSIRQPAALCGVVGLKPTYGRVSRYGLVAFASSLDQIGPFAHDLADAALLLEVIAGHDPHDSTSVDDAGARLRGDPRHAARPRCGSAWSASSSARGSTPRSRRAVREAVRVYEAAGATVREVSLPHSKYGVPAYYIVAPAECSSNLARYDGTIYGHRAEDFSPSIPERGGARRRSIRMMMASRAEGFGAEVKRRIMLGTFALSAGYADQYYNQALKVRRLIRNDFDARLQGGRRARSARPRRPPPSSSARRPPTRWRCTCRTSTRSRPTSPASPASASPAA